MDRRIKPWVNKKIVEYIGEPEPTLVDFICTKVLSGITPLNIIKDVQMVRDEECAFNHIFILHFSLFIHPRSLMKKQRYLL